MPLFVLNVRLETAQPENLTFPLFVSSARLNHLWTEPSKAPDLRNGGRSVLVPRPGDLPYLIVGIVLGAFVFIIVAFIPFCLWRAWAKQSERSSELIAFWEDSTSLPAHLSK